eukprot:gene10598-12537_t
MAVSRAQLIPCRHASPRLELVAASQQLQGGAMASSAVLRISAWQRLLGGERRYMALLSGGQILRRMSKAAMLLPDGQGGAIFEFEEANARSR